MAVAGTGKAPKNLLKKEDWHCGDDWVFIVEPSLILNVSIPVKKRYACGFAHSVFDAKADNSCAHAMRPRRTLFVIHIKL
jgi:hypothetical protein